MNALVDRINNTDQLPDLTRDAYSMLSEIEIQKSIAENAAL